MSAFEGVLGSMGFNNPMQQEEPVDVSNIIDNNDIQNLDDIDDQTSDNPAEDNNGEGNQPNDQFEDHSDIPEDVLNNNNNSSDPNEDDNDDLNNNGGNEGSEEVNENEMSNVGLFFDAFAEELGWDVADNDKPTNIQQLVDYIGDMIEQNSAPQYADDRVAQLDQYVKNGGRFEDFYQRQQEALSLDNMDMEDESNQKAAVREYLKYQGYNDDQITRKIDRYEDSDMLEEEAEDALAQLKNIRAAQLEIQERQQAEARQAQEAQAQQFIQDLTGAINSLNSIRGVTIPKEDRRKLYDYITRVDADGLTQYQKDFNSNMVNNLIESAYFTMKGDALLGEARSSGRTAAVNKLRTTLRHQTVNHSRYNVNDNQTRSVVDIASQFYK